ncbi:MAG: hypothetical protein RJA78_383 [Actinomycetota bacterium]|jgi:hypothetical protein
MEHLFHLNWSAIFTASILSFIIGATWFGPKTFYPVWMKALGREVPTERIKMTGGETLTMFGGTYLAALIQVSTLGFIISLARTGNPNFGAVDGLLFGFIFSVGLGAFASVSHRMFAQPDMKVYKSLKVWLIEVGQDVVCVTLAGLILGAWS